MKAAQIDRFGGPDVLSVSEASRPAPDAGGVLVHVEASSVNGHDVMVRSGGLKMVSGRKFPLGTGLDFAGIVAEPGTGAGGYRAGDRIWGTVHPRQRHVTGAAAEYVAVPADRVAPAPAGLTPADAASLVVAGTTALIALRDSTHLASGERVLVRGAAGGSAPPLCSWRTRWAATSPRWHATATPRPSAISAPTGSSATMPPPSRPERST